MTGIRQSTSLWCSILLTALLWASATAAPSIAMDYCASINTASMAANHSIYQSDGLCYDFCKDTYALAIVKGDSCWCSNFIPDKSIQVSTSKCNSPCPGFPDDICGGDGTFGYMQLVKKASGTAGAASSTSPPSSSSTPVKVTTRLATSTVQETVQDTVKATVTYTPPSSSSLSESSAAPTSATDNQKTTSQTPPTETATDPPQRTTITVGGTVKTISIGPTGSPQGSSSPSSTDISGSASHGLSAGAAAGVAVAVVASLLIIGGAIAWLMIKRRRKAAEDMAASSTPSGRGSSSGMMATPRSTEVSETRYYNSPPGGPERRRSTLMPVDPRLDPFSTKTMYNRTENKSHESVNTLEDNHDYSRRIQAPARVLRAVNPDPDFD